MEANQSARDLARAVVKAGPLTEMMLPILADMAEQSCCARHHRNKIWGSGLAQESAIRWLEEIQVTWSAMSRQVPRKFAWDNVSHPKTGNLEHHDKLSDHSFGVIVNEQIDALDRQVLRRTPHGQSAVASHRVLPKKPVLFAKHVVLESESLVSKLSLPIDPRAGKTGFLYVFTHARAAFSGMVKIDYTCRTVESRLSDWADCGHGHPVLLQSHRDVRYPERVELLTHFELLEHWYAQRWCDVHRRAHIEWFKTGSAAASSIVRLWSLWMNRANPYDRRGRLKAFWTEVVHFLVSHKVPIAAEVMMQVQELEEGSPELADFIDDGALRAPKSSVVKHEHLDQLPTVAHPSQRIKGEHMAEGKFKLESRRARTEAERVRNPPGEVTTACSIAAQHRIVKLEVDGE